MIDGQIKQIEAELKRPVVVEHTSNDLSAMSSSDTSPARPEPSRIAPGSFHLLLAAVNFRRPQPFC